MDGVDPPLRNRLILERLLPGTVAPKITNQPLVIAAKFLYYSGYALGMWLLVFGGITQLFFGLWMVFRPAIGGLTVVAVIAIYAIVIGLILILRGVEERIGGGGGAVAAA